MLRLYHVGRPSGHVAFARVCAQLQNAHAQRRRLLLRVREHTMRSQLSSKWFPACYVPFFSMGTGLMFLGSTAFAQAVDASSGVSGDAAAPVPAGDASATATPSAEPAPPSPPSVTGAPSGDARGEARVKALEDKLAAQAARLEALEQQLAEQNDQMAAEVEESQADKRLSAWGFFDVSFGKVFMEEQNGLYGARLPVDSSFMMNGINLYVRGDMSETLSALVETRLTFTPVGYEFDYPADVYMNGELVQTEDSYIRGNGEGRAPLTQQPYRHNGILIERAHLDWQPWDFLGIRLGRYLTPYGIWNEDHGSPVLLGVDAPNLINWELVPTRQTGLSLYGMRQLSDSLALDYAATLSNGRGPVDEYQDLDENKGVGLRLKLTYSTENLTLRAGSYGYVGRYTDRQERAYVMLNPDLSLDTSQSQPFGINYVTTEGYDERVIALDAMVKFHGLSVSGEYARRRVVYSTPPPIDDDDKLLNEIPFDVPAYYASYIGKAYYVLAGYEFDLGQALGGTKLTPYLGYDTIKPISTIPVQNMHQYRAGLNVKPSPWVTTKLETVRVVPVAEAVASKAWVIIGQVAVSF